MKNKILTINIIFILISLIFINNSFAYTATEDIVYTEPTNSYLSTAITELQKTYPEEEFYYVYGYSYGPRCFYLTFFEKHYLKIKPYLLEPTYTFQNNDYYAIKVSNDKTTVSASVYKVFDSSYSLDGNYTYEDCVPAFTMYSNSTEPVEFTANFNVYTNSSGTDFFFNSPVTEPEIPETVEIPAVETVEQIPTAMVETMKMIIPVGLVVLSVVLLIYLTRRLIYRCS